MSWQQYYRLKKRNTIEVQWELLLSAFISLLPHAGCLSQALSDVGTQHQLGGCFNSSEDVSTPLPCSLPPQLLAATSCCHCRRAHAARCFQQCHSAAVPLEREAYPRKTQAAEWTVAARSVYTCLHLTARQQPKSHCTHHRWNDYCVSRKEGLVPSNEQWTT